MTSNKILVEFEGEFTHHGKRRLSNFNTTWKHLLSFNKRSELITGQTKNLFYNSIFSLHGKLYPLLLIIWNSCNMDHLKIGQNPHWQSCIMKVS